MNNWDSVGDSLALQNHSQDPSEWEFHPTARDQKDQGEIH